MPEAGPDRAERLLADGLLRREGDRLRTTHRWQAAMVRSAMTLQLGGAPWTGLRVPIAAALLERYPEADDEELAGLVEAMLAVEEGELPHLGGDAPAEPAR